MAVLELGLVRQRGAPRDVYDRPRSRFVADFLGETNFLHAEVTEAVDGSVILETPAGQLKSEAFDESTPRSGNVTGSIRPEAIRIVDEPAMRNGLSGRRVQSVYLGEQAQHLVEIEDGTVIKVLEMNPTHLGAAGEIMHMAVEPRDVVILAD
jgi:spermidine/putrescine transport system ATP-binding protein